MKKMKMLNNSLFDGVINNDDYHRFDNEGLLNIYYGLDNYRRKTIILRSKISLKNPKSTLGLEFNLNENNNEFFFSIHLNEFESEVIFFKIINDILENTIHAISEKIAINIFYSHLRKWLLLFNPKKKSANESEIKGLIGELLFLKDYMIPKYGENKAVKSWTGLEKTKKDFSIDDTWYEVKTVKSDAQKVEISSIDQLDSKSIGYLYIVFLEKMSVEYKGVNLIKVIDEILNLIDKDTVDIFLDALNKNNINLLGDYSEFTYEIKYSKMYEVNDEFPRLRFIDLPKQVISCRYDILIDGIKKYETESLNHDIN